MRKKLLSLLLAGVLAAGAASAGTLDAASGNASSLNSGKFNMSYLYFGNPDNYVKDVDRTNGALQVVAPRYFNLTSDGNLQLSKSMDTAFINAMHARGIRVVPFLSNDWDRNTGRNALQNRDALSTQLAAAVSQYGLDGVNVDIENVTETDRDNYTDFVRQLRAKLPAGKEVSVAVAANPTGSKTGWPASYDLKQLVQYSDYLMLMAYDESYPGDPTPGPVASLPFVEKSIQAVLKEISPDKLVLGIPFYGRYWNGNPASDGSGVSNWTVESLIAKYHGVVTYDQASESVKATFTVHPSDPVTIVNYKPLEPGNYTVWYENERSIKAKLGLVQKYTLKGTGSWSLNQETKDTWNYYSLWLNGKYFSDTQGHWAEGDIVAAATKGWMTGVTESEFAPEKPLTRAEAAVVLVRAMGLVTPVVGNDGVPLPSSFKDVPNDYWAAKEIIAAQQKGYVEGVGDGLFAPDLPLTREQISSMLVRILALPPTSVKPPFSDVPQQSWSYGAIASISEKGLVEGYNDGTFRPQAQITRAQMAVLMNRIAPLLNQKSGS
jgi:spore germination protein YaaH